jgi:PIN like domain
MASESIARFFVDENSLALGRMLAKQHDDVVYPGHPALLEVPLETPDVEWLDVVGRLDLAVITRDKKIRSRPVERRVLAGAGVRGFVLTGSGDMNTAEMMALVERHWAAMEGELVARPDGPWLVAVTAAGLRPLRLVEV